MLVSPLQEISCRSDAHLQIKSKTLAYYDCTPEPRLPESQWLSCRLRQCNTINVQAISHLNSFIEGDEDRPYTQHQARSKVFHQPAPLYNTVYWHWRFMIGPWKRWTTFCILWAMTGKTEIGDDIHCCLWLIVENKYFRTKTWELVQTYGLPGSNDPSPVYFWELDYLQQEPQDTTTPFLQNPQLIGKLWTTSLLFFSPGSPALRA